MARNNGLVALETSEVAIVTATVSIQVLKLDRRQLTQAVFKQLPERPLVDEDKVQILGLPWGWVNYESKEMNPGRQFVAQFGDKLYRCPFRMRRSPAFDGREANTPQLLRRWDALFRFNAYGYVISGYLEGSRGVELEYVKGDVYYTTLPFASPMGDDKVYIKDQARIAVGKLLYPDDFWKCDWIYGWQYGGTKPPKDKTIQAGAAKLREILDEKKYDRSYGADDFIENMRSYADRSDDYCSRWDAMIDRLETVEQLFIAA